MEACTFMFAHAGFAFIHSINPKCLHARLTTITGLMQTRTIGCHTHCKQIVQQLYPLLHFLFITCVLRQDICNKTENMFNKNLKTFYINYFTHDTL